MKSKDYLVGAKAGLAVAIAGALILLGRGGAPHSNSALAQSSFSCDDIRIRGFITYPDNQAFRDNLNRVINLSNCNITVENGATFTVNGHLKVKNFTVEGGGKVTHDQNHTKNPSLLPGFVYTPELNKETGAYIEASDSIMIKANGKIDVSGKGLPSNPNGNQGGYGWSPQGYGTSGGENGGNGGMGIGFRYPNNQLFNGGTGGGKGPVTNPGYGPGGGGGYIGAGGGGFGLRAAGGGGGLFGRGGRGHYGSVPNSTDPNRLDSIQASRGENDRSKLPNGNNLNYTQVKDIIEKTGFGGSGGTGSYFNSSSCFHYLPNGTCNSMAYFSPDVISGGSGGGRIVLKAKTIELKNKAQLYANGVEPSGWRSRLVSAGSGAGGTISIVTEQLILPETGAPTIQAKGANGSEGTLSLSKSDHTNFSVGGSGGGGLIAIATKKITNRPYWHGFISVQGGAQTGSIRGHIIPDDNAGGPGLFLINNDAVDVGSAQSSLTLSNTKINYGETVTATIATSGVDSCKLVAERNGGQTIIAESSSNSTLCNQSDVQIAIDNVVATSTLSIIGYDSNGAEITKDSQDLEVVPVVKFFKGGTSAIFNVPATNPVSSINAGATLYLSWEVQSRESIEKCAISGTISLPPDVTNQMNGADCNLSAVAGKRSFQIPQGASDFTLTLTAYNAKGSSNSKTLDVHVLPPSTQTLTKTITSVTRNGASVSPDASGAYTLVPGDIVTYQINYQKMSGSPPSTDPTPPSITTITPGDDIAVLGEYDSNNNRRACPAGFSKIYTTDTEIQYSNSTVITCVRDNLPYTLEAIAYHDASNTMKCPADYPTRLFTSEQGGKYINTCASNNNQAKVAIVFEYSPLSDAPNAAIRKCPAIGNDSFPNGTKKVFTSELKSNTIGTCLDQTPIQVSVP